LDRGNGGTHNRRAQTAAFERSQAPHLGLPSDFRGALLDFGCGLGDAMPVYRERFPFARLIGVDLSEQSIRLCKKEYGPIAQFMQGDHSSVPDVDVIIASHVLEHLSNDIEIARHLLSKCRELFVITPYRQVLKPHSEHVHSYDESYFRSLGEYRHVLIPVEGWTQKGWDLIYHIHMKNFVRRMLGRRIARRRMQIMFHFRNEKNLF
jgi:SAM-dependent methyltransferase